MAHLGLAARIAAAERVGRRLSFARQSHEPIDARRLNVEINNERSKLNTIFLLVRIYR